MKKSVAVVVALSIVSIVTIQGLHQLPGLAQQRATMRGTGIEPLSLDDNAGFESIFEGRTLAGWDGDPAFWRLEDETIIGESTPENPLKTNTFLIYRGSRPADFELKLEYRINAGNSGVQYRSVEMPDAGRWIMKGYQADIDFANQYTGQLYEERGRGFLAMRGQMTHLQTGGKRVIANLRGGDELKAEIKNNDWNHLHIIARGNHVAHIINGHLMAQAVDDDAQSRMMNGLIGFQIHTGPPMKVEFRRIRLKQF